MQSPLSRVAVALMALLALPSAALAQQSSAPKPAADDSGTMKRADKTMRAVLKELEKLGAKPVEQLSVEDARKQPTPADAVKEVLKSQNQDPVALMAAMKVTKKDLSYPTGGGSQPIRIYTPEGATGALPVIVYYHGGGWVIADLDTYESSSMALAKKTNAIVASVEYRKAPEAPYPAAHDDAFNAYKWVVENAQSFNGDPARLVVAGESAGGNLAVATAIRARDQKLAMPLHILSVYPVAGTDTSAASYQKNEKAMPLSKAGMEWFFDKYAPRPEDRQSAELNLYTKANLKGLPPTTIINAEIDPLLDDGALLEKALKQAGVDVRRLVMKRVVHEFFGMDAVLPRAERAQKFAAQRIKAAFALRNASGFTEPEQAP